MKRNLITCCRYMTLLILAGVAVIGLFSVPQDNLPLLSWMRALFLTKAIGLAAFAAFFALIRRWAERGAIL